MSEHVISNVYGSSLIERLWFSFLPFLWLVSQILVWSISGDSVNDAKQLLHFYVVSEDLRTVCGWSFSRHLTNSCNVLGILCVNIFIGSVCLKFATCGMLSSALSSQGFP